MGDNPNTSTEYQSFICVWVRAVSYKKTTINSANSIVNVPYCNGVYIRTGTGDILGKVVLHFPKIMCMILCVHVNRFYVLCTYILYTLTYRGVCVMCIHINYGMYVTCTVMICNIHGRPGNIWWMCPMFKIFKIFVKFLRFSRILAKILIVLNFRTAPDPPTVSRVPRTSPADIFNESLYPPVVFIFWYNFMVVAFR